jgi:hypothetical protein
VTTEILCCHHQFLTLYLVDNALKYGGNNLTEIDVMRFLAEVHGNRTHLPGY